MKTPIAFIIFKRPDTTEKVFELIRQVKPPKLLVVADGARPDIPGEAEKCAATRAIIDRVDWDCEVLKNYSATNLGCGKRVSSGLDWVFQNVEEAIILEDDCLPDPTFFRFCEELLEKYRHDRRVMMISGTNVLCKWKSDQQSYHFSNYTTIWGWASWRRAWNFYDYEMKLWSNPEIKNRVKNALGNEELYLHRKKAFDEIIAGNLNTWDLQWLFTRLVNSGLSIVPSVNLISNIGFNYEGTHATDSSDKRANLPTFPVDFPLEQPDNQDLDLEYSHLAYTRSEKYSFLTKVNWRINKLKKIFNAVTS